MIKKIFLIFLLSLTFSCCNSVNEELKKSGKSSAASTRINSSQTNSDSILKDLDE